MILSYKLFLITFCVTFFGSLAFLDDDDDDTATTPPMPMFNITHKVYMDFKQGDKDLGRIIFGLFGEIAPKTVENFRTIATVGIKGKTYAGTNIHRVIHNFLIQGGDIINNDGSGETSIYGRTFEDETHEVKFWAPGFLAMANHGPNTNGCQFFVTCTATSWLDGDYVGFGKVIYGLKTVHLIEKTEANDRGRPKVPIKIVKCGELPLDTPVSVINPGENPYTIKNWIKASAIPLVSSFVVLGIFHWMIVRLERFEKFMDEEIYQLIDEKKTN